MLPARRGDSTNRPHGVGADRAGKPAVCRSASPSTIAVATAIFSDRKSARIDLTITDDFPQAQAIVIISALPSKADLR